MTDHAALLRELDAGWGVSPELSKRAADAIRELVRERDAFEQRIDEMRNTIEAAIAVDAKAAALDALEAWLRGNTLRGCSFEVSYENEIVMNWDDESFSPMRCGQEVAPTLASAIIAALGHERR